MTKVRLAAVFLLAMTAVPALAAPKTYQVTGPVTAMDADTVTVQKGTEKWEIAKGTATMPAGVQVGSKVTIMYSMTATSITAKAAK